MDCICSSDWLLSYDIKSGYINGETLRHTVECEAKFQEETKAQRDLSILRRWQWATATNESCDYHYSHRPHGLCSGRAFDRT